MRSTINTGIGPAVLQALPGAVQFNGAALLPHEAMLIASELERMAKQADKLAGAAVYEAKFLPRR